MHRSELRKYNQSYFRNHYWREDLPGKIGNRGLSYNDPDHGRRFDFLAHLLRRHFAFESILDVGCGLGGLLDAIRNHCHEYLGCEASTYAVQYCRRRGLKCLKCTISRMPLSNKSYDLVWCSDVLEHLPVLHVFDAVTELARVTKSYLVLTINLDNPYAFHPTILSRPTWTELFLLTGILVHASKSERLIQEECRHRHPEYEFFVFRAATPTEMQRKKTATPTGGLLGNRTRIAQILRRELGRLASPQGFRQ